MAPLPVAEDLFVLIFGAIFPELPERDAFILETLLFKKLWSGEVVGLVSSCFLDRLSDEGIQQEHSFQTQVANGVGVESTQNVLSGWSAVFSEI